MRELLNIGSAPHDEDCAQVGTENYQTQGRKECRALANQMIRLFGEPPFGAMLVVKSFPHDFGSYQELCVSYDSDNEDAEDYAFQCEMLPEKWDAEARVELGL